MNDDADEVPVQPNPNAAGCQHHAGHVMFPVSWNILLFCAVGEVTTGFYNSVSLPSLLWETSVWSWQHSASNTFVFGMLPKAVSSSTYTKLQPLLLMCKIATLCGIKQECLVLLWHLLFFVSSVVHCDGCGGKYMGRVLHTWVCYACLVVLLFTTVGRGAPEWLVDQSPSTKAYYNPFMVPIYDISSLVLFLDCFMHLLGSSQLQFNKASFHLAVLIPMIFMHWMITAAV